MRKEIDPNITKTECKSSLVKSSLSKIKNSEKFKRKAMMKSNSKLTKLYHKIEIMRTMHSTRKIRLYKFSRKLEEAERLMRADCPR
jgi:hypothetical protein